MEFERIQEIIKNFSYEKQQIKQQIADIELRRTQLAQKRNEKKLAIVNMAYTSNIENEIYDIERQISELGNQSQDLQNKLDVRVLEVKAQVNARINNLMTSDEVNDFSIEELNGIKRDVKNGNWEAIIKKERHKTDKETFEEKVYSLVQRLLDEQKEKIKKCEEVEKKLELPSIAIEEINIEDLQPIGDVKVEEISPIPEVEIEDIEPIEEIQIEMAESISEIVELQTMEEIQIEEIETLIEIEETKPEIVEQKISIQDIIEEIEEEIITLEQQEVEIENNISTVNGEIRILNIIAKIVSGEVVYNAQISNGETIKIYPTKDKEDRNKIKDILLTYAVSEHKILDKKVIKDVDFTICQILNEFAYKYNCNAQELIYNYAMSFSENAIVEIHKIPQITYNFSFIEEAEISKKEKRQLMKICKNARKNDNIEVVGYSNALIKAKYFFRRLFAYNVKGLPEGKF